ncbi:MAG: aminoglycoside phosphotransferase family protein [Acidimicrobiales bacterium]
MAELVIPTKLAATVVRWEGDGGRRWLARLPQLVEELADEWDLEVGEPFDPGGNISWVAPVRCRADGLHAVLKLQHPHPESDPEAAGLRAWAGHGAVQLHDHDSARCALLIERCRPGTALVAEGGSDDAVAAGAALGARLHAAPVPRGLPTLASVLDGWADELEARLDEPIGDPALGELALATMRTRPRACRDVALLHGDLNPTNVLAADRERWLAIDPKPMAGDPAYDAPRLVTQPDPSASVDPAATMARRLDVVSAEMGVERDAVVVWCLVDAIEMSASARAHGDPEGAKQAAERATLIAPHLS